MWRGVRNAEMPEKFVLEGGTELAPMSTTSDLKVALEYSASKNPILLRLVTSSFMDRGADIGFLSAFPTEKEILYPPLTFLCPVIVDGCPVIEYIPVRDGDAQITVFEVRPSM